MDHHNRFSIKQQSHIITGYSTSTSPLRSKKCDINPVVPRLAAINQDLNFSNINLNNSTVNGNQNKADRQSFRRESKSYQREVAQSNQDHITPRQKNEGFDKPKVVGLRSRVTSVGRGGNDDVRVVREEAEEE